MQLPNGRIVLVRRRGRRVLKLGQIGACDVEVGAALFGAAGEYVAKSGNGRADSVHILRVFSVRRRRSE